MLKDNLKILRKSCGFNQEDVAKVLGIDRSAYSYYESGKTEPNLKNLAKISRLFGVDICELLGETDTRNELVFENEQSCGYDAGEIKIGKCSQDEKVLIAYFRLIEDKQAVLETLEEQYRKQESKE